MDNLRSILAFNVRRVYKVLSLSTADLTYRLEANDRAVLEATALNFSGVHFQEVQIADPTLYEGQYQLYEDVNDNGELDPGDPLLAETTATNGQIRFSLDKYVMPELRYDSDTIDGRYWEYFDTLAGRTRFFLVGKLAQAERHPLEWSQPEIEVSAVNAVTGEEMPSFFVNQAEPLPENSVGIVAYDASDFYDIEAPELGLDEFLQAHPEFSASQERKGAVQLSGPVTISGTVIIPKSVPLILQPGANITMMPSASILAYGGLSAVGTPEEHIRIHGNDSGRAWGSLAVIRPSEEVVVKYADVMDGGQAQINGILLTGGFAVHDGDLRLEHSSFTHMQSEDGLNIKNGTIHMSDCLFSDNASDGVDIDFGIGDVRDCQFTNNVNDGIDISGSQITVTNGRFENNGDKGFSVGEDSHLVLFNGLFRGNQIGLSTKDLSHAQVTYSTFVDNVLAIEAKRKKPFFGGGSGEFINSVFSGNQVLLEDDYFSSGQALIHHSMTDDPVACPACWSGNIHFSAPETGDYRLAPGLLDDFELALVEWTGIADLNSASQLPGIITAMAED